IAESNDVLNTSEPAVKQEGAESLNSPVTLTAPNSVADKPAKARRPKNALSMDQPHIFILDSLAPTGHPRTFTALREYLQEEANHRLKLQVTEKEIKTVLK